MEAPDASAHGSAGSRSARSVYAAGTAARLPGGRVPLGYAARAHWRGGACLADDMGLGKTVQALAVFLDRAKGGPALVVAPTSVCPNWMDEARRFGSHAERPSLRTRRPQGNAAGTVGVRLGDRKLRSPPAGAGPAGLREVGDGRFGRGSGDQEPRDAKSQRRRCVSRPGSG